MVAGLWIGKLNTLQTHKQVQNLRITVTAILLEVKLSTYPFGFLLNYNMKYEETHIDKCIRKDLAALLDNA